MSNQLPPSKLFSSEPRQQRTRYGQDDARGLKGNCIAKKSICGWSHFLLDKVDTRFQQPCCLLAFNKGSMGSIQHLLNILPPSPVPALSHVCARWSATKLRATSAVARNLSAASGSDTASYAIFGFSFMWPWAKSKSYSQ